MFLEWLLPSHPQGPRTAVLSSHSGSRRRVTAVSCQRQDRMPGRKAVQHLGVLCPGGSACAPKPFSPLTTVAGGAAGGTGPGRSRSRLPFTLQSFPALAELHHQHPEGIVSEEAGSPRPRCSVSPQPLLPQNPRYSDKRV